MSFIQGFEKYMQGCLVILMVLAGSGISIMVAIASPPANYSYYAGVILVFMMSYGFIKARFVWATLAGWINVAFYEIVAVGVVHTPGPILVNNNFFFFSATLIGMVTSYSIELYTRKDFYMTRRLAEEQNTTKRLNRDLEQRVMERTADLKEANERLQQEIDAHRREKKEREKLERQLMQAQKMESIGTLAGGIAHDFNNILSSILGYTELTLDEVKKNSDLEDNLQEIYTAGIRAKDLIKQILAFARQSDEEMKPVQVSAIVKEVLQFLRSSIPSTIEIRKNIQSDSLIIGNATQIHQVMMNLCTNAAQAMEANGGTLAVGLRDVQLDETAGRVQSGLKPGGYVELQVSDTGQGIDPEILDSIFDPYFTTKGPGEGTGMGLSMVHGIVESYSGKILVESTPGQGSTFTLYLPISTSQKEQIVYRSEDLPLGTENVLLVDDEAPLTRMTGAVLKSLGYSVTSRTSSLEALELFSSKPDDFDLVITDMTMPNMTGDQLAVALLKIRRDIPVILCTGYSKKVSDTSAAALGIKAFAYKPIVKADLARTVRKVLDGGIRDGRN